MFNLFKKKTDNLSANTLAVSMDIHSHILPGLDDGSPDVETSLQLIRGMYALGYRKFVATPHIIGDMYRNDRKTINAALQLLKDACVANSIDIELTAAAEYMLDDYFMNILRRNEPLLTIQDNLVLTELSYASATANLHEIVFEILTNNYIPILAHPERYAFYHRDYSEYDKLKDIGFLFQVNLLSLTGYYGPQVAKSAKYLFDKGMVNFVGSDLHHERHLANFQRPENLGLINKYLGEKDYGFTATR